MIHLMEVCDLDNKNLHKLYKLKGMEIFSISLAIKLTAESVKCGNHNKNIRANKLNIKFDY